MYPPSEHAYGGQGPLFLGISWLMGSVGTALILVRFFTAVRVTQFDYSFMWAAIAWALNMTMQVFETLASLYGIGNHLDKLSHHDTVFAVKYFWIGTSFGIPSLGIAKLAVIALLFRVQGDRHPRMKWILYGVAIITNLINFAQVALVMNQCTPAARLWDKNIAGTCDMLPIATITGVVQSAVSCIGDFILGLYPIFIMWSVKMPWKKRVNLSLLLGIGILATVCGVVKTVELRQTKATSDYTYALGRLSFWAFSEMWLVVILACIPPLRPLYLHFKGTPQRRSLRPPSPINERTLRGDLDATWTSSAKCYTTGDTWTGHGKNDIELQDNSIVVDRDYTVEIESLRESLREEMEIAAQAEAREYQERDERRGREEREDC